MVKHCRSRFNDTAQGVPVACEVGNQHLDPAIRKLLPDAVDAGCEDISTTIGQVVAVHRCDDAVAEIHRLYRIGQPFRFLQVDADGAPRSNGAVVASPRADVAQNHESCGTSTPALSDIGAMCFLAHGVQLLAAHEILELHIPWASGHLHLQPIRQAGTQLKDILRLTHQIPRSLSYCPARIIISTLRRSEITSTAQSAELLGTFRRR